MTVHGVLFPLPALLGAVQQRQQPGTVVAGEDRGAFGPLVELGVEILEQKGHRASAGPGSGS